MPKRLGTAGLKGFLCVLVCRRDYLCMFRCRWKMKGDCNDENRLLESREGKGSKDNRAAHFTKEE